MAASSERWNHNILYHSVILDAIPPGCRCALDVGCGVGTLTRELRQHIPEVVGIDSDHASIAAAKRTRRRRRQVRRRRRASARIRVGII